MPAANQCEVTLGTTTMTIQRVPTASNATEVYTYTQIVSVVPVTRMVKANVPVIDQENWKYRFPTTTIIEIGLTDGRTIKLELQEVSNQPTWNLGTQAAQNQAITDIQTAL